MLIRNAIDHGFSNPIAMKCGIPAALVFNRIAWSINYHQENSDKFGGKYFQDEKWWMNDSFESLRRHFRGLLSLITIKRAVKDLEKTGLLIGAKRDAAKWDQTKWYAIDVAVYTAIESNKLIPSGLDSTKMIPSREYQNETIGGVKLAPSSSSNSHTVSQSKSPDDPGGSDISLSLTIENKTKPPKYDPEDLEVGQEWLEHALSEMKWKTPSAAWTPERFAKDLRHVRKITGLTPDGIRRLLEFIKKDKFWKDKALSPASLLKKNGDDQMKVDTILLQATKNERRSDKIMAMLNSEEDPF